MAHRPKNNLYLWLLAWLWLVGSTTAKAISTKREKAGKKNKEGAVAVVSTCQELTTLWEQKYQQEVELRNYAETLDCNQEGTKGKKAKKGKKNKFASLCYNVQLEFDDLQQEARDLQQQAAILGCTDDSGDTAGDDSKFLTQPLDSCDARPDKTNFDTRPFNNKYEDKTCCTNGWDCESGCCVVWVFGQNACGPGRLWNTCTPPLCIRPDPAWSYGASRVKPLHCCLGNDDCDYQNSPRCDPNCFGLCILGACSLYDDDGRQLQEEA